MSEIQTTMSGLLVSCWYVVGMLFSSQNFGTRMLLQLQDVSPVYTVRSILTGCCILTCVVHVQPYTLHDHVHYTR